MLTKSHSIIKRLFILTISIAYLSLTSAKAQSFLSGACSLISNSKTCIDTTPCKLDDAGNSVCLAGIPPPSGGFNTTLTCWQYSYAYACETPGENTCSPYQADANCSVVSSQCTSTIPETGTCNEWSVKYKCASGPPQTTSSIQCTNGLFDDSAFTPPPPVDSHFKEAIIGMEIAREAEVYNENGANIFSGVKESCTYGYYGIKNCCKSAPGGKSNSVMMTLQFAALSSVVKYAGQTAINYASPYMYDAMYSVQNWMAAFLDAESLYIAGEATAEAAAAGFSLSAFGFTYSTTAIAEGSGLMGGNTTIATFGAEGSSGFLAFNPYMLALQLAIMYVASLTECTNAEQMLSMHKGSGLSQQVGTDSCTSNDLAGGCTLYKKDYCSFNSVLAKIINTQGKQQLGRDLSDCSGLTITDISAIDFRTIDFTEFTGEVNAVANNNQPPSDSIKSSYTAVMTGKTSGTSQQPSNPNIPTYPEP